MPAVAVVDTSVWVSAFLNAPGYPARVYRAAREGKFRLVTSVPLLEELAEVLSRSRVTKLRDLSNEETRLYLLGIAEVSTLVQVTGALALCRDPNDDVVLETAIVGNATHVVSRDEDLTRDPELAQQLQSRGIQLATVNQFLNELAGG